MDLITKYNTTAPRYTSYPTVPYWDNNSFNIINWGESIKKAFKKSNKKDGISLYIHLPFCESLCTYCGCNTRITVNHAVETPYIDALLKEWELYLLMFDEIPIIKEIHLGGGTPTFFSPENLKKLISEILSKCKVSEFAEFSFEAHPNNTQLCHLKTLYDLGFRRISLGIQDFDPKVQEIINRNQTYERVKDIVQLARKVGYHSINFDLIYGLPLQTKESIIKTFELVLPLKPERIAFYSYAHVPWIKPGQRKFTESDLPADIEKRNLYELGRTMLLKNSYREIGMDHFSIEKDNLHLANINGLLHRNFMGYTDKYTQLLIGLGVSSISDTWYSYAQNCKTVEEYQQTINNGLLPVFKGHCLTNEDLIIRQHILNIMCKHRTSWKEEKNQCDALFQAIKKLSELEKDELVDISEFELVVTEKGKAFLRNICMCFDARLWKATPSTPLFSSSV